VRSSKLQASNRLLVATLVTRVRLMATFRIEHISCHKALVCTTIESKKEKYKFGISVYNPISVFFDNRKSF